VPAPSRACSTGLQAKHEEALAAAAADKAAVEEAKAGVEASLAERQAEVEALQAEVAGLKESLAAAQAQLGEQPRGAFCCDRMWWLAGSGCHQMA